MNNEASTVDTAAIEPKVEAPIPQIQQSGGGGSILKNLKVKYKPSLFTRILFNGGAQGLDFDIMGGGAKKTAATTSSASVPEGSEYIEELFKKSLMHVLLLTASMYIAYRLVTFSGVISFIFKDTNLDDEIISDQESKTRYKKMVLFLTFFVLLTAVCLAGVTALFEFVLRMTGRILAPNNVNSDEYADEFFHSRYDTFMYNGIKGDIKPYAKIRNFSLIGVFIFVVLYMLFVKSFLKNMHYPVYTDDDELELSTYQKFILNYIILIIYFILFCVGLLVVHHSSNDLFGMVLSILILSVYSLIFTFFISFQLRRKNFIVSIATFAGLVGLVLLNMYM